MEWRLAEAKNKFSEVVNRALEVGPQRVLRRNEAVIILSQKDFDRLTGQQPSFKEFILKQTPRLDDLNIQRDSTTMRDIEL